MSEPVWLTREVVSAAQATLLERFGGLAGLRDEGLLESALHRPRQVFAYAQPRLCDLAAAYAAALMRNHPFLDGNQRIGFMAAYIFLEANGLRLAASEESVVLQTLALAAGELEECAYAAWLADACRQAPPAA
jgi:death-on-curing protein